MNVTFDIPVGQVPQAPGAAPMPPAALAAAGSVAKTMATRLVVDVSARAGKRARRSENLPPTAGSKIGSVWQGF